MEKVKVIQIGMFHEHAIGKIEVLKTFTETFELIGYVDERDFCNTPRIPNPNKEDYYSDIRKMTLEEALNYPGLEAVTVEVPNNDLVPIALKCMERNLAMHMDKPAGPNLALFKRLLDGCKEKNLPFQMGYMFRGNPVFKFCLKAIKEKLIGEVCSIEADMNHCYGGELYQEYIAKFPGGLMYNLGCHLIDFIISCLGRPDKVHSFLKSAPNYSDYYQNNCMAVLEYPHTLATIFACSKDAGNTTGRSMKIVGTKGTIKFTPLERFDGKSIELELTLNEESGSFPKGVHILKFPPQVNRYSEQMLELVDMIRNKKSSSYTFEHDYIVHEVVLAASGYIKYQEH